MATTSNGASAVTVPAATCSPISSSRTASWRNTPPSSTSSTTPPTSRRDPTTGTRWFPARTAGAPRGRRRTGCAPPCRARSTWATSAARTGWGATSVDPWAADDIPFDKSFDLAPDTVEEVAPGVRRVLANNPGPFTFKGTVSYIIGRGQVAIVDPGPLDEAHIAALLAAVRN